MQRKKKGILEYLLDKPDSHRVQEFTLFYTGSLLYSYTKYNTQRKGSWMALVSYKILSDWKAGKEGGRAGTAGFDSNDFRFAREQSLEGS